MTKSSSLLWRLKASERLQVRQQVSVGPENMGFRANPLDAAGISIVSAYFSPGPTKNRVFAAVGAGQPVGFILGLVLGKTSTRFVRELCL
jgi:hypothetical protein